MIPETLNILNSLSTVSGALIPMQLFYYFFVPNNANARNRFNIFTSYFSSTSCAESFYVGLKFMCRTFILNFQLFYGKVFICFIWKHTVKIKSPRANVRKVHLTHSNVEYFYFLSYVYVDIMYFPVECIRYCKRAEGLRHHHSDHDSDHPPWVAKSKTSEDIYKDRIR